MKWLYKNPKIRALIGAVLTCLIGVSLGVLGDWNPAQGHFVIKLIVFLVLTVLDIIHILKCVTHDSKEILCMSVLWKENKALKKALSGIILICQSNSSDINKCIHQYMSEGKLNKEIWNFKKACYHLCATIYTFVTEMTENEDVEVSYIKLNESVAGEVQMFSYKNSTNQPPCLLNKKRNYLDSQAIQYYDMKMFVENRAETKVLYGSESINIHFYRTPTERQNNPNKYNQYIAVPVFCDNQKMIGLLQIACINSCSLAEDEKVLEEVAKKYFVPYANMFLLLHKMNKALELGI